MSNDRTGWPIGIRVELIAAAPEFRKYIGAKFVIKDVLLRKLGAYHTTPVPPTRKSCSTTIAHWSQLRPVPPDKQEDKAKSVDTTITG